jgi:hypothetical protein
MVSGRVGGYFTKLYQASEPFNIALAEARELIGRRVSEAGKAAARKSLNSIMNRSLFGPKSGFVFEQVYGKATELLIKPGIERGVTGLQMLSTNHEAAKRRRYKDVDCDDPKNRCRTSLPQPGIIWTPPPPPPRSR